MAINLDNLVVDVGGISLKHDFFTPTPAQTLFVLTQGTPVDTGDVIFKVNGVVYAPGVSGGSYFTVTGTSVTWANVFLLDSTDRVEIIYSTRQP